MFVRSYDLKKRCVRNGKIMLFFLFVYFVSCFEATGSYYKVHRGYKQVFFS